MPSCVFYHCSNHSRKNTKTQGGVTFHSLPKDELRKRKWLKIVRQERNEPDWTPTVHSRVCSEHFKPEDIYTTKKGMIRISPKAIPGIQGQDTVKIQRSSNRKNRHSAYKRIVLTRRGFTQAEDIVANVYNYLQKEFEELKSSIGDSCDLTPLANILKRTASATGVSEDAVSRILENKKRSANYERDAAVKRVKLTHDSEDGDDSSITDEESSCEEQEADQESTDDDNQKLIEFEVETLKVEIDEHEYKPLDPLQLQTNDKEDLQRSSNVAVVPIVSNTTHTENTTQPAVVLYPQSSAGVLRVKPFASLTTIKTEPDNEHTHRLPKDELRKRKWLKIVRQERNEPDWTPTVHSRVCSEHFKPEDIYTTKKGMIRISPKAIPGIQGHDTVEIQRSSSRKNRHSAYKRIVLTRRGFTQAEDIVANVYNYLQKEFEELKSSIGDSCDLSPLANILKRTASATGVSEDAVSRILENKKRSADYERDADVKRVKLTHDSEDGDDSSITDEESSCEEQEADQESTDDDNQKLIEFEVETLKVEIDEHEYKPLDPLQLQTNDKADLQRSSNVAVVPIVSNTTHTENTTQPAVVLYPQSSAGVLRVKPISSLTAIKTEPEHTHSSVTCTGDVECDTTLCDVKCEPPDS